MAELYLNYRNDERAYAQFHEELVRANPTTHSFVMLGEAYMKINEADKAIAALAPTPTPSPTPTPTPTLEPNPSLALALALIRTLTRTRPSPRSSPRCARARATPRSPRASARWG